MNVIFGATLLRGTRVPFFPFSTSYVRDRALNVPRSKSRSEKDKKKRVGGQMFIRSLLFPSIAPFFLYLGDFEFSA